MKENRRSRIKSCLPIVSIPFDKGKHFSTPDTLTTVYAAGWVKELLWARQRRKNPLNLN